MHNPTSTTEPKETAGVTTGPQGKNDLPFWLPDGCPSWCAYTELHRNSDHYDDRSHSSTATAVALTATNPQEFGDPHPIELQLNAEQHYREREPRIWLGRDDTSNGVHLTLDEAQQLGELLLALAGEHRN